MKQIILFGAGIVGKKLLEKYGDDVFCFADNYKTEEYYGKKIISFEELKRIHRNYDIIISASDQLQGELVQQCRDCGITISDRNGVWRQGCNHMQSMVVVNSAMTTCCSAHKGIRSFELTGDWQTDYSTVHAYKKSLIKKLERGEPCDCDGCSMLKEGFYSGEPDFDELRLTGGIRDEKCNAKCIYCTLTKSGSQIRNGKYTLMEPLNGLSDSLTEGKNVVYSPAEITISPFRKEFFEFIRQKNLRCNPIMTSAILYSDDVEDMLKNRNADEINISLDCGTRETYKKIKGIDAFDLTVNNIEKYRQSAQRLVLKYIFLEGINDNKEDVLGFLEIAKKNTANTTITVDYNTMDNGVSDNLFHWIEYVINTARMMDLPVQISQLQFNNADAERVRGLLK